MLLDAPLAGTAEADVVGRNLAVVLVVPVTEWPV